MRACEEMRLGEKGEARPTLSTYAMVKERDHRRGACAVGPMPNAFLPTRWRPPWPVTVRSNPATGTEMTTSTRTIDGGVLRRSRPAAIDPWRVADRSQPGARRRQRVSRHPRLPPNAQRFDRASRFCSANVGGSSGARPDEWSRTPPATRRSCDRLGNHCQAEDADRHGISSYLRTSGEASTRLPPSSSCSCRSECRAHGTGDGGDDRAAPA